MFKQLQDAAGSLGVHLGRMSSVPFGVDAYADVGALIPDLSLAFDVGANFGQTVVKLRKVFPSAKIVSFEPIPATFPKLLATAGDDPNVECVMSAVGDFEGEAQITTTGQGTLHTHLQPEAPTVTVKVLTVDGFCAARGIQHIDLLKIDTEGFEMPVLRGAKRMLESGAVSMVLAECEFTPNATEPHGDFFEIAAYLMPLGYRVAAFYCGGVDGNGWRWGDALFMHPMADRPVTCSPYG